MTQMWLTACGTLHVENPRSSSSTKLWTSTSKIQKYGIHVSKKGIEKKLRNYFDYSTVRIEQWYIEEENSKLSKASALALSPVFPRTNQINNALWSSIPPRIPTNSIMPYCIHTSHMYIQYAGKSSLCPVPSQINMHGIDIDNNFTVNTCCCPSFPHICTVLTWLIFRAGGSVYWIRQCLPGELWLRVPVRVDVSHGSWQHAAATCRVRMCRASPVDLTCPCQSRELFVKWFVHDVCEADSVMPIKATLINSSYCIHMKYASNY